jgi:hypothetical protein
MSIWKRGVLFVVVLGCGESESPDGMQDQAGCEVVLLEMSVADSATGVSHTPTLWASFSQPVLEQAWSLTLDGVPGQAALSEDGLTATFEPDAPLLANEAYALTGQVCGRTKVTQFSTLGPSVSPEDLVGRVYGVPFGGANWTEPSAWSEIVELLGLVLPEHLLVKAGPMDGSAPVFHAAFTARDAQVQSPCDPVIAFGPPDLSQNPIFASEAAEASIALQWYGALVFESIQMTGELLDAGETLGHLHIQGLLDSRALELVGEAGPYTACETAYVDCVPCADGLVQCIPVHIEAESGVWWPDVALDEGLEPESPEACWAAESE